MALVYITGISGSGKTTVRNELRRRGYIAYGTDEDDLAHFYNNETGERIRHHVTAEDRTQEWRAQHTWKVERAAIERLREEAQDTPVFLCGVVANDTGDFWDLFDIVFALNINEETLRHRITTRTNNDHGKNPHEFEGLLNWQKTAQEDYERLGAVLVDAMQPLNMVVDEIVRKSTTVTKKQDGAPTHLQARKPGGGPHQSWSSNLILQSSDWIITHSAYRTPVRHHTKDLTYVMQHSNVGIFNTKEYYNVFIDFHNDGRFKMLYVNVATPAELKGGVLSWTDLYLDIIRMPDGQAELVDQDEFDEAIAKGLLANDLAEKAEAVASDLMPLINRGEFPFLVKNYSETTEEIARHFGHQKEMFPSLENVSNGVQII